MRSAKSRGRNVQCLLGGGGRVSGRKSECLTNETFVFFAWLEGSGSGKKGGLHQRDVLGGWGGGVDLAGMATLRSLGKATRRRKNKPVTGRWWGAQRGT